MLIGLLLVSSIASSQIVTDTNKIVISTAVAKAIAKDLVRGDSAIETLKLKERELKYLEDKITIKDSIISLYRLNEVNYKYQVLNETEKVKIWQNQYKQSQKEYKKLSVLHKFTKIASLAIISGLTYLYISK